MIAKNLNIVNVYNEHRYDIKNFDVLSQKILQTLAKKLDGEKPWIIAAIFTDEMTSQKLNLNYRQKNYIPDVLSFGNENNTLFFVDVDNEARDLGDVYICYPQAVNQADDYGHSLIREICFLFLHGLLHTLGYDHETKEEEKIMFGLQDEVLNQLNITKNKELYMKQIPDLQALLKKAKALQNFAYAPYSLFRVAAIVTLKNGSQINGVNVENVSYPTGICAERNALGQAFAQGYKKNDISYLFLITDSKTIASPCGVCRQFMIETMPNDANVYISDKNDNNNIKSIISVTVKDLLPMAFSPNELKGN